uniref:Amine sulfotransferase-like n=1 Tax=Saccoglossus kowalevskii TaxID=10224 RepID=A0ABM0MYM4_SACKO|nr:PREDICTED: amine sulfotransferase-like [Saccoglossus kowalevskii]
MAHTKWPVFEHDGCYFVDKIHDIDAVKERRIDRWDIRDDDVIIQTFPKSGTLWMLHAVSLMYDDLNWKLNPTGKSLRLGYFYEKTDSVPGLYGATVRATKCSLHEMPSPRLMLSHLHPQFFHTEWRKRNRKCKIICITRNPKDVCVSFYNFLKSLTFAEMHLSWDDWVEAFIEGRVWYGPWLQYALAWNQYGLEDNVIHVTFEDMKQDLKSVLVKIADFLGRPLTEETIDRVVAMCSLDEMRASGTDVQMSPAQSGESWPQHAEYFRKGQIGDWKKSFHCGTK